MSVQIQTDEEIALQSLPAPYSTPEEWGFDPQVEFTVYRDGIAVDTPVKFKDVYDFLIDHQIDPENHYDQFLQIIIGEQELASNQLMIKFSERKKKPADQTVVFDFLNEKLKSQDDRIIELLEKNQELKKLNLPAVMNFLRYSGYSLTYQPTVKRKRQKARNHLKVFQKQFGEANGSAIYHLLNDKI